MTPATPPSKPPVALTVVYALLSVGALVVTWYHNLSFLSETNAANGFVAFWQATCANHPSTSITLDLVFLCAALFIWMVRESRAHKIRFVWAYIVASVMIAVSFAFPLFLIARLRAMHAEPTPATGA